MECLIADNAERLSELQWDKKKLFNIVLYLLFSDKSVAIIASVKQLEEDCVRVVGTSSVRVKGGGFGSVLLVAQSAETWKL